MRRLTTLLALLAMHDQDPERINVRDDRPAPLVALEKVDEYTVRVDEGSYHFSRNGLTISVDDTRSISFSQDGQAISTANPFVSWYLGGRMRALSDALAAQNHPLADELSTTHAPSLEESVSTALLFVDFGRDALTIQNMILENRHYRGIAERLYDEHPATFLRLFARKGGRTERLDDVASLVSIEDMARVGTSDPDAVATYLGRRHRIDLRQGAYPSLHEGVMVSLITLRKNRFSLQTTYLGEDSRVHPLEVLEEYREADPAGYHRLRQNRPEMIVGATEHGLELANLIEENVVDQLMRGIESEKHLRMLELRDYAEGLVNLANAHR